MIRDNLREAIKSSGMVVKEIASISGVSKRTIDKWIGAEEVEPRINDFMKVCKSIGVSAEDIVFGKKDDDFEDRHLLDLAKKYQKALSDLEDMDDLQRSTVLIQIEAVADSCRKDGKKKNG